MGSVIGCGGAASVELQLRRPARLEKQIFLSKKLKNIAEASSPLRRFDLITRTGRHPHLTLGRPGNVTSVEFGHAKKNRPTVRLF